MELTRDKIDLISKIIKNDRKYPNNEDLYEDFLNETCKRSAAIFETLDNEATLETYLRRIVTTSIINVLKNSGRLRRSKKGYVPLKEIPLADVETSVGMVDTVPVENLDTPKQVSAPVELNLDLDTTVDDVLDSLNTSTANVSPANFEQSAQENTNTKTNYSCVNISYLNVKIPTTPEDVAIQKETLEFVADTIRHIDTEYPNEKYMQIYILRYEKGMTQKEIANELEISQSEVSKRLFGLINKVKNIIEK